MSVAKVTPGSVATAIPAINATNAMIMSVDRSRSRLPNIRKIRTAVEARACTWMTYRSIRLITRKHGSTQVSIARWYWEGYPYTKVSIHQHVMAARFGCRDTVLVNVSRQGSCYECSDESGRGAGAGRPGGAGRRAGRRGAAAGQPD